MWSLDYHQIIIDYKSQHWLGVADQWVQTKPAWTWCWLSHLFSGGKVRFSSVQRAVSLNLELNQGFSSGHPAEPWTKPTVQFSSSSNLVQTSWAWNFFFLAITWLNKFLNMYLCLNIFKLWERSISSKWICLVGGTHPSKSYCVNII